MTSSSGWHQTACAGMIITQNVYPWCPSYYYNAARLLQFTTTSRDFKECTILLLEWYFRSRSDSATPLFCVSFHTRRYAYVILSFHTNQRQPYALPKMTHWLFCRLVSRLGTAGSRSPPRLCGTVCPVALNLRTYCLSNLILVKNGNSCIN